MKLVYTNKASIPLNEYEQIDAITCGRFGINFPIYCFEKKGLDDKKELCEIFVYPLSTHTRQKLLTFSAFVVGHLGVFAFLFQVFDDRGLLMKACCYLQLGLLILAYLMYLGTFVKDRLVVLDGKSKMISQEEIECLERKYDVTFYCAEQCDDLALNTHWIENEVNVYYYLATGLECSFVLCLVVIECLTIVYVYNNT